MHSSDTNVSSYYDTNSTGNNNIFQNKQHFLSFINATSFNPNKYKILNIINKKESMDLNNINRKQTNSILNKLLNNQSKRENVLSNKGIQDISFNSDKLINNNVDNIFLNQLANQSKNNPIFNKSYNPHTNNIITNNYQTNINEKTQKINYALESHQLINSLLKNQKKNSKKNNNKNKVVNNPSEISFSSSFDNTKKMFDISPSKDSIELSSNNNNQNDSFSKNVYSQYCNQNKENKETVQINNNINNINTINNISYDNNIFLGLNKDNNDKQNQNNQHFNSPHYNFYNNNTNKINNNYRNKHQYSNSPLRMADVFMLKKHHSIKPYNKAEKNNCLESITFSNKNVKKIIFIKPSNSKSKDDEEKNEDEIKVIRQKDKNGKKEIKNEMEINNIKITTTEVQQEKKLSGIKFFKDIINEKKENKGKSEIKINKDNKINENK